VPERTRVSEQATGAAHIDLERSTSRQVRQADNTMRLPLEIAMEVGSFLDRSCLAVCTMQLCRNGVGFVSRPSEVRPIHLYLLAKLCRTASHTLGVGQEQADGLATEAIKRIDLWLARRTSAEMVVFVFNVKGLSGAYAKANTDFYSDIHRHYSLSSNRQFNNGQSVAVEWHACARSKAAVKFLIGGPIGGRLSDVPPLAWCQSLHSLDLRDTADNDISGLASYRSLHTLALDFSQVSDVSSLASCPALHTLYLTGARVSDVSALASCQVLHTLYLDKSQVRDVSALASCQALHTLDLSNTQVSDVSALASNQTLRTLDLYGTQVSDVSALASCQSLHTLNLNLSRVRNMSALAACGSLRCVYGSEYMIGYEAIARLLESRTG
jgi:Leucine-rich repeat (LRR) protein